MLQLSTLALSPHNICSESSDRGDRFHRLESSHMLAAVSVAAVQEPERASEGEAETRDRHSKRAVRFGTGFVEPKERLDCHQEFLSRKGKGFKTGLDVYSEEELAKRQSRAARFNTDGTDFNYAPPEDADEAKKRERAARFGTEYQAVDHTGLQQEDILEERKEHGAAVQRRQEAIHMYGVDKLSTKEVLQYFDDYGPVRVEWIDDSSCNVVFADGHSAKRAVIGRGQPLGPGEAPDLQGLGASDIKNLPFLWHKGADFMKRSGQELQAIPVIYRMATVDDKKGMAPTKKPRFLWKSDKVKKGLQKHVGKQRKRYVVDEDGDVQMGEAADKRRKSRGDKRKRSRAASGQEIDMQDAEDNPLLRENGETAAEKQKDASAEAEEMLEMRARQKAEGPSGLFSAARAGILPSFLVPADEMPEANGIHGEQNRAESTMEEG